jgi:chromosomal replication initiation ATPase DnaA
MEKINVFINGNLIETVPLEFDNSQVINFNSILNNSRKERPLFTCTESDIRLAVVHVTGIPWETFSRHCRKREFVEARQLWCYFNKLYNQQYTCKWAGRLLGRDHTSVINAIQTFVDLLDTKDERAIEIKEAVVKFLKYESKVNQPTA